jgi:hypothetical protein
MKVIYFNDDEIVGSKHIVISKIDSYGLTITEFNGDTGCPKSAIVWIETGHINHNKSMPYADAVELMEYIDECIETTDEDEKHIQAEPRLIRLEGMINGLSDMIKEIKCAQRITQLNKTPHKCPICNGAQVRIYLNTDVDNDNYKSSVQEKPCHACDGKGIVWG